MKTENWISKGILGVKVNHNQTTAPVSTAILQQQNQRKLWNDQDVLFSPPNDL